LPEGLPQEQRHLGLQVENASSGVGPRNDERGTRAGGDYREGGLSDERKCLWAIRAQIVFALMQLIGTLGLIVSIATMAKSQ
jgi:hypothetical protein